VIQRGAGVDLTKLPILRFYEQDAGRYITSGLVAARDPDRPEVVNLTYARMQLKGGSKIGTTLHSRGNMWSYFEKSKARGKPLDIAVIIGAHPRSRRCGKITGEYAVTGHSSVNHCASSTLKRWMSPSPLTPRSCSRAE
jgi:UbiD family decarboxylase